ncbi:MAG: ferrous iron transport protein B [Planctomycetes bacterium]|nr:ferrous iron transport protein B [Planctomycetota bacterium]
MSTEPSTTPGAAGPRKKFKVALAGNPNCGKTTLFNCLTGTNQHVGNYPGVTVESKSGEFTLGPYEIELVDLPGVYSLSSSSPEEEVVFEELTRVGSGIDLIVDVVNCAALQRNLYLTTQLAELHIPMIIAFNMSDEAEAKGLVFDIAALSRALGSPIVKTVGHRSGGRDELCRQMQQSLADLDNHDMPKLNYGDDVNDAINQISAAVAQLNLPVTQTIPPKFFAIKLLEKDKAVLRMKEFAPLQGLIDEQIRHLYGTHAIDADTFMADRRYALVSGICRTAVKTSGERRREISDKIDTVMTNRFIGLPLFLVIMYLVFWFTFTLGEPPMDWIEGAFDWLKETVNGVWPEGKFQVAREMITDGVIGGVGGVLVFLPNIVLMFLALAFLEDSGYMARAAFVMDGVMRRFGLQGRSFVPLVLGFGCNVPAIMATRSIESERDRKTTIMVLPLMSCGARLPIYTLLIPAFFPDNAATMMFAIYIIGVVIALVGALLLKSTLFKGDGETFLLELPPYRCPTLRTVLMHMWERSKMYIHKAGTIILAASIVLFICNKYPEKEKFSKDYDAAVETAKKENALSEEHLKLLAASDKLDADAKKTLAEEKMLGSEALAAVAEAKGLPADLQAAVAAAEKLAGAVEEIENAKQEEAMEYTISGRIGHAMEKVFRPLGFDWRVSTALIGALAAKEVFVSQLGILYSAGEADEESETLREALKSRYSKLQAFAIMLFCLLSIPCIATVAVVKRELNSWMGAFGQCVGLLVLAYVLTLLVFQIGSVLQIGVAVG